MPSTIVEKHETGQLANRILTSRLLQIIGTTFWYTKANDRTGSVLGTADQSLCARFAGLTWAAVCHKSPCTPANILHGHWTGMIALTARQLHIFRINITYHERQQHSRQENAIRAVQLPGFQEVAPSRQDPTEWNRPDQTRCVPRG